MANYIVHSPSSPLLCYPYYNQGHVGKGQWMKKYTESFSITPASYNFTAGEAEETDDSVSDHIMSEFDEDEWETDSKSNVY